MISKKRLIVFRLALWSEALGRQYLMDSARPYFESKLPCMKEHVASMPSMHFHRGGVKTERVFPGLSVLRKNNKMEVLSPEK